MRPASDLRHVDALVAEIEARYAAAEDAEIAERRIREAAELKARIRPRKSAGHGRRKRRQAHR